MRKLVVAVFAALVFAAPAAAEVNPPVPAGQKFVKGPCTTESRKAFTNGDGHDHADISQHRFSCGMELRSFLPLDSELGAREDVYFGEMDVKNDIAVVGVAFPESGFVVFDVSDPAKPVFKSWYRSSTCESLIVDVDCGAYVTLSADGKTALIAVQNITFLPQDVDLATLMPAIPGTEVVDISDPSNPRRSSTYADLSMGPLVSGIPIGTTAGVHTVNTHVIPSEGPGPRTPGEFVFHVSNNRGIEITRLDGGTLQPVSLIELPETHDTFIQVDPTTKRSYLYIASGFDYGFYVYDVTDAAHPELLATWDLTPECPADWYSHTIDVRTVRGRRFVTMPVEAFTVNGPQDPDDQAEGCGSTQGNGDKVGVLWIVEATDFSKLGQPGDSDETLASKSREALVATWGNAAEEPAGNIMFTPHNQQIVGDRIYLSSYHAGVFVLDAKAAFRGKKVRPRELGFVVPHGEPTRPLYELPLGGPLPILFGNFFTSFSNTRPNVWDMVVYKGITLAADMTGGFYAYEYKPAKTEKPKKKKKRKRSRRR